MQPSQLNYYLQYLGAIPHRPGIRLCERLMGSLYLEIFDKAEGE